MGGKRSSTCGTTTSSTAINPRRRSRTPSNGIPSAYGPSTKPSFEIYNPSPVHRLSGGGTRRGEVADRA